MNYHQPTSFAEAAELAASASGVTRVLAGGTDVLVQMRADIVTPDTLIDIKAIDGVRDIRKESDGSWTIGAAVAGAEMSEHDDLSAAWPGVVEAMDLIGSTQVQGRATLVGNLCNASPAADSVPAMVAAGASVSITGPDGNRRAAVVDIPAAPGKTTLKPGELITAVHLPPAVPGQGDAYLRFIPRTEMDIAVVGCGVWLRLEGDTVADARVALGAVAPTVLLVQACADALIGSRLDDAALGRLATAASDACSPITDKRGTIAFRTQVAGVMARRAAETAYARAKGDKA
ncbi:MULTISPECIES: FAD binding domain-containing protein [unclassified Phaeobacter]|uniref:FAD binding domain-containing protein n=1 Tax=unclassified Phaeobacter TaxID=2621772 RepID=UPI003A879533